MKKAYVVIGLLFSTLFILVLIPYQREITTARSRVLEQSQVLTTAYGDIEYAVEGAGPAVLLIHGAGGGYDQGMLIGKKALGESYLFISVSRFGYLRSSFTENPTVEEQARMYLQLLNHLEIDKVTVVGASAGGPSALQFVYDYPERSRALILLSAVSKFMGDVIPVSTQVINWMQRSDFVFWAVLKILRPQFSEMVGIPQHLYSELSAEEKLYADNMLDFMNPVSPRCPGNIHESNIRPLSGESMNEISTPTIIFHAMDDALVTFDHGEFVHQNVQNSEFVFFETGGHALIAELEVISTKISDFLSMNH